MLMDDSEVSDRVFINNFRFPKCCTKVTETRPVFKTRDDAAASVKKARL